MVLFGHFRVGKRVIGGDVVLPRCVNWTCNSRKKIRWFNELDRLIGESRTLEPTDAEKEKDYWKSFNPEHLVRENAYKVGGGGAVDEARDDDSNNEERERELNREEEGERESNREEECVRESNREDESETESTREEEEEEQYHYHIPDPRVDSESTYLETRTKRAHEFRQGEDQHDDTPVPRDCSVAPGPSQRQEPQTKVGKIMALLESILKTQQEQNKRLSKIERMLKIHVPPDGGNDPNDDDDDDDDYDDDDDTESSIRNEYIHCSLPPKRASPLKTAPSPKRQYSVDVLVRH